MNVLIRTDSAISIGSGHLMRCLTLANQLREMGAVVKFACRDLPGAMHDVVRKNGYTLFIIPSVDEVSASQRDDANATVNILTETFPEGCDLIVVDHYQLDENWETIVRAHTNRIMVIDDLANRRHDCDLLLDQNHYSTMRSRYHGLVPENCVLLLGPSYVLLRQEFLLARQRLRLRDGTVKRILVFFGGSDLSNQTEKVIVALGQLNRSDIQVDVVIGQSNPYRVQLESLCKKLINVSLYCQVSNMAELINQADLGVGAGGAAMWERCFLGLPTITVVFAGNQEETTLDVAQLSAIEYLGWCNTFSSQEYKDAIEKMLGDPGRVRRISDAALTVVPQLTKGAADIAWQVTNAAMARQAWN